MSSFAGQASVNLAEEEVSLIVAITRMRGSRSSTVVDLGDDDKDDNEDDGKNGGDGDDNNNTVIPTGRTAWSIEPVLPPRIGHPEYTCLDTLYRQTFSPINCACLKLLWEALTIAKT